MIKKTMWIGLAISMLGLAATPGALAAQPDASTVLTFNEPIEIPGQVLPAGTYAFSLLDSMVDRHVVQISTADGSRIIATVMTIPHYRLDKTEQTVITYDNTPSGAPAALRAWFHPNDTVGHEFVYPRTRAVALAKAANAPVPATAAETADATAMRTEPIVTVAADGAEAPVVVATTESPSPAATRTETADTGTRQELPRTASNLPLLALLGFSSISAAFGLMLFSRRRAVAVV